MARPHATDDDRCSGLPYHHAWWSGRSLPPTVTGAKGGCLGKAWSGEAVAAPPRADPRPDGHHRDRAGPVRPRVVDHVGPSGPASADRRPRHLLHGLVGAARYSRTPFGWVDAAGTTPGDPVTTRLHLPATSGTNLFVCRDPASGVSVAELGSSRWLMSTESVLPLLAIGTVRHSARVCAPFRATRRTEQSDVDRMVVIRGIWPAPHGVRETARPAWPGNGSGRGSRPAFPGRGVRVRAAGDRRTCRTLCPRAPPRSRS